MEGVFLKEGEHVYIVDPDSGAKQMDFLEDERAFNAQDVERKVTSPDSNRKILAELKKYTDEHEARYGRFPKTLIFAANDIPHTSHAQHLVDFARELYDRGDSFVSKITGKVDRPLQRIREFRNRPQPGITVTVDLLSTGVDIPDLEFIVFLRPVKSRILFEQMLGRGTRKSENLPDKSHFTVFDCFDGTLIQYFRDATGITAEDPAPPARSIVEVIDDVWANRDRDYNSGVLVKRLHRIEKEMSGAAREEFARYVPDGDVGAFAAALRRDLREDFTATMKLLRDPGFQELLLNHRGPRAGVVVAEAYEDTVTAQWLVRGADGKEYKPEDYLAAWERFVRENPAHIEAIQVLLARPREWSIEALKELRAKLRSGPNQFTEETLQKVHELRRGKALADIISMVKHAADADAPLLNAEERTRLAFVKLASGHQFTPDQQRWLDHIRDHLVANLSIDRSDFDNIPVLANAGGWGRANRIFDGQLAQLITEINEAIAA
jgi:type I restriction enzyme R subunit